MAYDEALAERVRKLLFTDPAVDEIKMFGGLCFTLHGNMVCGILDDALMLRLTNELAQEALSRPHVRPMDFTGRRIRSMVFVDPPGLRGRGLRTWVDTAVAHARTLPPKR